jgi:heat shock protein HslJ
LKYSAFALFLLLGAAACLSPSSTRSADPLANTAWLAEDIGGRGVGDYAQSTLIFDGDARVVGSTACNHFSGLSQRSGNILTFHRVATTRRACAAGAMDEEMRFLEALDTTTGYRVDEKLFLLLIDDTGHVRVRLSRIVIDAGNRPSRER